MQAVLGSQEAIRVELTALSALILEHERMLTRILDTIASLGRDRSRLRERLEDMELS